MTVPRRWHHHTPNQSARRTAPSQRRRRLCRVHAEAFVVGRAFRGQIARNDAACSRPLFDDDRRPRRLAHPRCAGLRAHFIERQLKASCRRRARFHATLSLRSRTRNAAMAKGRVGENQSSTPTRSIWATTTAGWLIRQTRSPDWAAEPYEFMEMPRVSLSAGRGRLPSPTAFSPIPRASHLHRKASCEKRHSADR